MKIYYKNKIKNTNYEESHHLGMSKKSVRAGVRR